MDINKQNLVTKNAMELLRQTQSNFAEQKKKSALDIFNSIPMPKEKDEDWRYTQIDKFDLQKFSLYDVKTKIFATKLSEDLIERGIILTDINTALEKYPAAQEYFFKGVKADKDKFTALNAAYFNNGIFLYVPKNAELEEPIRLNFELEEKNSIIHNIIIAEPNSNFSLIEEYSHSQKLLEKTFVRSYLHSPTKFHKDFVGSVYSNKEINHEQLNSCVTEVFANDNSKINFYHLNNWTKNVYNFTSIIGAAERDAEINWISGCFGAKINRLRIDTNFNGQGSQCSNIGVFLGRGKEHIDFTTNVYHNAVGTTNDIMVEGILKDESTSVYRGLIRIEKIAQKTNSYLDNKILKLGEKTLANSIPSLKIDANDVKASHGATVGQINEDNMFYLMARGLSRQEAERLIVEGFFEPVIQKIPLEELREKIRGLVRG